MDIQDYTTEHSKGQHLLAEECHEIEVRLKDGWSAPDCATWRVPSGAARNT